jgi:succinate-acetate transporter protein
MVLLDVHGNVDTRLRPKATSPFKDIAVAVSILFAFLSFYMSLIGSHPVGRIVFAVLAITASVLGLARSMTSNVKEELFGFVGFLFAIAAMFLAIVTTIV